MSAPEQSLELDVLASDDVRLYCSVCDGTIFVACDYQPAEYDIGVHEAYICGRNVTMTDTCTCMLTDEQIAPFIEQAERNLLEQSEDDW